VLIFYGAHAHTDYIAGAKFDADGVAIEHGLIPGPARIHIHRRNDTEQAYVLRDIELKPDAETEIHVNFAEADASLEGIVTWQGVPARKANIKLRVDSTLGTESFTTQTTSEGAYWFDEVPEGMASMKIEVWHASDRVTRSVLHNVPLVAGNVSRRDVQLLGDGAVAGTVLGLEPGRTAQIVAVEGLHSFDDLAREMSLGAYAPFTSLMVAGCDPNGNYSIESLEAGDYTIVAQSFVGVARDTTTLFASAHIHIASDSVAEVHFEYP
jgi:hypothetical protein